MFTDSCVGNKAEIVILKGQAVLHCANIYLLILAVTHPMSCFYWPSRHVKWLSLCGRQGFLGA